MQKMKDESKMGKVKAISSKPVLGVPLGPSRIIIYYAGQSVFTELEGELSDATTLFTNPDLQDEFKQVILEEIAFLRRMNPKPETQNPQEPTIPDEQSQVEGEVGLELAPIQAAETSQIALAEENFRDFDFTTVCNILILQESFGQKHLIVQVGRLHTITEYASFNDRSQWNFVRGQKVKLVITGAGLSFAHEKRLLGLGDVYLHMLIPDDRRQNSELDLRILKISKWVAEILPYMPQMIEVKEHLKAKDDIIKSKDDTIKKMRYELSEKSTRLDAASIAVANYETEGPPNLGQPTKFGLVDAVLLGGPIFLFAPIGSAFGGFGWFAGLALGFLVGCGLVARRR